MKIYTVLLCLLLIAVTVSPQEQTGLVTTPVTCCYSVTNRKIPLRMLQSYERITSTQCPREAVIFHTKRGRFICVNPEQKWVNEYMKILDQKSQILQP